MSDAVLSILCLVATLVLYYANKKLYRRFHKLPLMPLAAAKPLGGQPDLVALFVVITGVFGMAVGDMLFLRLAIREGMAKGAGFGAASHGAGTARSYELGQQEGVVASLVMMLSGVVVVLAAPVVRWLLF